MRSQILGIPADMPDGMMLDKRVLGAAGAALFRSRRAFKGAVNVSFVITAADVTVMCEWRGEVQQTTEKIR